MRYTSAKDLWITIIIFGAIGIMIYAALIAPEEATSISYYINAPLVALLLWIYYSTYYEFHDQYLLCRCGPMVEKIRYDKIKSLRLTQNMWSSMALSTRRIEIKQHGKGFILGTTYISPENREKFLSELKIRCPHLSPPR